MGGGVYIQLYIRVGISLGLERGRKVYFRESENIAIKMSLNQGRLVQCVQHVGVTAVGNKQIQYYTGSLTEWKFIYIHQPLGISTRYV